MNNIIIGPANSGKSIFLYKKLLSISKNNPKQKIFVLVPEQNSFKVEKDFINLSDGHGIMNIEVLSFARFCHKLMEEAGDNGLPPLDEMGKSMIIRRILSENNEKLLHFASKERIVGFVDELKSLISELSIYRIKPEDIKKISDNEGNSILSRKLKDIYLVYSEYLKRISGIYSVSETLPELTFKHIPNSKLLKDLIICFDGYTGFTPIQYELIEHLNGYCKDFYYCISGELSDNSLFSMPKKMVEKINELGEKAGIKTELIEYDYFEPVSAELRQLSNSLFRRPFNELSENGPVEICSYKYKKQQAISIAGRIKRLMAEKNYRYSDFAVVVGDLEANAPYFDEAFSDFEFSYFIDMNRDVLNNPLISFVFDALSCVTYGFKAEDVASLIKNPLFSLSRADAAIFENYLICYNYRGEKKFSTEWTASKRFKKTVPLDRINSIRELVVKTISYLPKKKASINEWVKAVYYMLDSVNAEEKLEEMAKKIEDGNCIDSFSTTVEYNKIFENVILVLEKLNNIISDEVVDSKEFTELFEAGVNKLKCKKLPPNPDCIMVGDLHRSRLADIKVLFVANVNEGVIPKISTDSGILSDNDRELFSENGLELAEKNVNKLPMEEYYLYLNLSKPSEKIYLSYLVSSGEENSLKPSYVISMMHSFYSKLIDEYNGSDSSLRLNLLKEGLDYSAAASAEGDFDSAMMAGLILWMMDNYDSSIKLIDEARGKVELLDLLRNLSSDTAKKLYGEVIKTSVSRLESFAACPYKFFADYGLGLSERVLASPNHGDYGTTIHEALHVFLEELKKDKVDFKKLTDEDRDSYARAALDKAINNSLLIERENEDYLTLLISKYEPVMLRTCKTIISSIAAGNYVPDELELPFNASYKDAVLHGIVDRVDVDYENKLLKVVDYKTGKKGINYVDIYYGTSLQLPVYLASLLENKQYDGYSAGAMFYQRVGDDYLKEGAEEDIVSAIKNTGCYLSSDENLHALDRNIISGDGVEAYKSPYFNYEVKKGITSDTLKAMLSADEFKRLCDYASGKIVSLSSDIKSGKTCAETYETGTFSPCNYCSYGDVCGKHEDKYTIKDYSIDPDDAKAIITGNEEALLDSNKEAENE